MPGQRGRQLLFSSLRSSRSHSVYLRGARESQTQLEMVELDPLCRALFQFRQLKYEKCVESCEVALTKNSYDQAAWILKAMALTRMVHVDDLEIEEEGIAESLLDDNATAQVARPGTSLRTAATSSGLNQMVRPITQSGRPLTGMVRPGTQGGTASIEKVLKTARTAMSARPVTSSSGRYVRMGTVSSKKLL